MSDEEKIEKSESATEEASTQGSHPQQKIDYAKWIGVVATFLSIFLAFLTYRLDAERRNAEAQLGGYKKRQEELAENLEEIRGRAEIVVNFYFEGAATAGKKFTGSNSLVRLYPNEVYNQLLNQMQRDKIQEEKWEDLNNLMRCVYGIYRDDPKYGAINSRQILYFDISYNPPSDSKKPPAEKIEITYRFKDFKPFPARGSLTRQFSFKELNSDFSTWQSKTLEIEQLNAGSKVIIPLAHMIGPYTYSERLVIPTKISWYNPLLNRNEEKTLDVKNIMSDLDAKSQGSLLGNIGKSCQQ